VEPEEQFEDVFVREVLVDFDFAADQALFGFVGALRFGNDFERADVVGREVSREEDEPEFAFSQGAADFEVACGERGGRLEWDVWACSWRWVERGGAGANAAFDHGQTVDDLFEMLTLTLRMFLRRGAAGAGATFDDGEALDDLLEALALSCCLFLRRWFCDLGLSGYPQSAELDLGVLYLGALDGEQQTCILIKLTDDFRCARSEPCLGSADVARAEPFFGFLGAIL
jgi:hypothetical protein